MASSKRQSKLVGRLGGSKTPTNRVTSAFNSKSDLVSKGNQEEDK